MLQRTGGNPRTSPGSNSVVVVFLLGGVAWYAAIQSARVVVRLCRRERSGCESLLFSLIRLCRHFFFSFSLSFLLGVTVLFCPSSGLKLYRMVAILICCAKAYFFNRPMTLDCKQPMMHTRVVETYFDG